MLKAPAAYPHPGAYALVVDDTLPLSRQRAELVRILETGVSVALVAYPLRTGGSGSRRVALAEIMDATPLTRAEQRELTDLQRTLTGRRVRNRANLEKRARELKNRLLLSDLMQSELRKLNAREAREQPSVGSLLPRDVAA